MTSLSDKERKWSDAWSTGFAEGYKKARAEIKFILNEKDLNKLFEKLWRKRR